VPGSIQAGEQDEELVVTGTRIPGPAFGGTIPGVQISGEQIDKRAFTNALDALTDVPFIGAGASSAGTNGGQRSSLGQAYVDLFDLGSNRTLTLINGRRYISGNAATLFVAGNTTGSQVDLSTIPSALIERIDAVTVGGAVAYGSDAIAGVVNIVLKDDYEGFSLGGLSGLTDRGDGARYRLTATAGHNFAGSRGNVMMAFEYDRNDAMFANERRGYRDQLIAPTSFRNGGVRNSAYKPSYDGSGGTAFLPSASDLVPNNIAGTGYRGGSLLYSFNGAIFNYNTPGYLDIYLPGQYQGALTTDPNILSDSPNYRPEALYSMAGNVNLVPGRPTSTGNGCNIRNLATFCNFAPSVLPGSRGSAAGAAARDAFVNAVITRYAAGVAGSSTANAAARDALALNLLQANLQTPRDYLKANPGTNVNAFIGTFAPGFLSVPNTDPVTRGVLPRVAVPLQFDQFGGLRPITAAVIADPAVTPSTTGGAIGGDTLTTADTTRYGIMQTQQDRYIANLVAHFDISDALTVYTENQFADVRTIAPRNTGGGNLVTTATAESAALAMQLSNPFLSQQARSALTAAGVTDRFILSRNNQDIFGDNPTTARSRTYRSVLGVRGSFPAFGKTTQYDASFSYGRNDLKGTAQQIKDIEYALAVDAVSDGKGGAACRSQTAAGAGALGTTPFGVVGQEIVRERDASGRIVERVVRRVATAQQIAACVPLNVFGYNRMSQAARDYVLAQIGFRNTAQMYFGQASLGGELVDLPGGPLRYALFGEYRREELDYRPDELSRIGGTRNAALAATQGQIQSVEFGGELGVPIFGKDFSVPLLRAVEFHPGIRFVRQTGKAPSVDLLDGTRLDQRQEGKWNQIYSLAGTWNPIGSLQVRGNWTRSIRQPSITELFLGGQPSFTSPGDPCSSGAIGQGIRPDTRRANCRAAVIAAGLASNAAGADAFLNDYVPSGTSITGVFAGSPGLKPERGRSWTAGAVFTPAFIPRLRIGGDYIEVTVEEQIISAGIGTAAQICFDSPTYPDTSAAIGVNTCKFFRRLPSGNQRAFEFANGYASGFINQGGLKLRAVNATLDYSLPLSGLLGPDAGTIGIYANAYHLIDYLSADDNNFADAQQAAGSIGYSKWRTQARGSYENGGFFAQWVWNWANPTRLFSGGAPVPGTDEKNEVRDFIIIPSYSMHNASVGYSLGQKREFRIVMNVSNVFDKLTAGTFAQSYGQGSAIIDDVGRRYTISASVKF
jgi:outer membrane receptor protein involved in Fe transport